MHEDVEEESLLRRAPLAEPVRRLLAFLVDYFLFTLAAPCVAAAMCVVLLVPFRAETLEPVVAWIYLAPYLGLLVLQAVLLTKCGQSIGKIALGVRVVSARDSSPVGFVRAFLLRTTVPLALALAIGSLDATLGITTNYAWKRIDLGHLVLLVDVLWIFGPEHCCLHDHLADTKVVRWEVRSAPRVAARTR